MAKYTVFLLLAMLTMVRSAVHAAPGDSTSSPKVREMVSHVIDAYGGEKALRSLRGYHASGNQWAQQLDTPIHFERWFGRPDRLRLELDYPDHHETRVTDGAKGWVGVSIDALEPANPVKLQAMRLQSVRLDLPIRLLDHENEIEVRGDDAEGRAVLRVPIDTGLYIDYHIDLKSWMITHVAAGMSGPPAMEFAADYDQFHRVDGVSIPYHEVTYAGGTMTSKLQVIDFAWNPKDLDENLAPGPKAAH